MKRSSFGSLLCLSLVALLVGAACMPTVAEEVTLFSDNFDNVTVGAAPSAQVGTWNPAEGVVADTVSGAPSGTQYLDIVRPDYDEHWGQASAVINAGTSVHAEFYLNGDASAGFLPQFGLWSAGGSAAAWPSGYAALVSLFDDGKVTNYDGADHVDTGLTWTAGAWEKYEIDYVVGASSYDLTVGGTSTTVSGILTPGAVQGLYFTSGDGAGTYRVDSAVLTAAPGPSGILSIGNVNSADPSTWTTGTTAYVGQTSYGKIVVEGGTAIYSANAHIGTNTGITGEATISGAGSSWTLSGTGVWVGNNGIGTLTVESGATFTSPKATNVGNGSAANGTIVVSGSGTVYNTGTFVAGNSDNGDRSQIGIYGTGTVEITGGAKYNDNVYACYLGRYGSGNGTINVDGAGSEYHVQHYVDIGYEGTGAMNITNGGKAQTNDWFSVGGSTGGNGTLTINGAGSQMVAPVAYLCWSSNSTVNLENGGALNAEVTLHGWYLTSNGGSSTVNFDGGVVNTKNWLGDMGMVPGHNSAVTGTGTINTNGLIVDSKPLVFDSAASLTQSVTGFGSDAGVTLNLEVNADTAVLGAGFYGKGSITVSSGVDLAATNPDIFGISVFYLGRETGSDGSATITGAGSSLEADSLFIGRKGEGIMKITDGGLLKVNSSLGTSTSGGSGSVDVSSGGMIALTGNVGTDISTFLGAIGGDANIRWWNDANGGWEALTTAAIGSDYTLAYQSGGELAGYTLLTVLPQGPDAGDANCDGIIDTADLDILNLNYGDASGLGWEDGDFDANGIVDAADRAIIWAALGIGLPGDLNGDGAVNSGDLDLVRGNWGRTDATSSLDGDATDDGIVNSADLDVVRANWGSTAAASVPEPGVLMLVLAGFLSLALRRK